ncbi:RNA polymerase sigma factor [Solitalea lacus]|uniref:RNA polymerase sigma factor n=1 Tax=Solitalea lacus TaxID=2911172 RepID=UPI001EDB8D03|nr:RNA polymerase sigma-70 factor [Solitalea lacus]UKJ07490.1 RNA polymerase sigma-70 factor [Solitalea lacus]
MNTNKDLILLLKEGNEKAFSELYNRYWEIVYNISYRKLRDEDKAKDFVQEVFVGIWIKREQLNEEKEILPYLYTILKNGIIDQARKDVCRNNHIEDLQRSLSVYEESTHDQLAFKELKLQISAEVENLPQKMKEVYRLSREEGLTINEISERLSLSDQTVKNQITTALKRIRAAVYTLFF